MPEGHLANRTVRPSVRFVGSDKETLDVLRNAVSCLGIDVISHPTASDFLEAVNSDSVGCVVLDVHLPGISGLELLSRIRSAQFCLPFIFATAHSDIALAVKAMKSGAFDFLAKPCRVHDLIESINNAVRESEVHYRTMLNMRRLKRRYENLTDTQRKVMNMIVEGLQNKEIASRMLRSEMTIKAHRRQVMSKMEARTLPDLVRFSLTLSELT